MALEEEINGRKRFKDALSDDDLAGGVRRDDGYMQGPGFGGESFANRGNANANSTKQLNNQPKL